MRRLLAVLGYLAILVWAYRVTSSVSGLLLTGLGPIFFLDKYLIHLVPWPPFTWRCEIALRCASFILGAVTFYLLRPGIVPLQEAVYRGVMVFLAAPILERACHTIGRPRWRILAVFSIAIVPWQAALHPLHTVPKRAPDALGLAFEDVHFPSRDGTRLAAWLIPHPSSRGNVIYCHGLGRNRGQGAGVFTTLHGLGLNILAFDFRGHGDSAGHTSTFGDREAEDLLAAARYVRARFPDQPLFLMGISLGASVALQALPQIPDVCGVWSEAAFSRLADTVEKQFSWIPGPLQRPVADGYYVLGWLDCGFWGPSINPVNRLEGLTVPIFFCHGEKDRLVPFAEGQELYDAYTGPKSHWWVKEAVHYNIRQRNLKEYQNRLEGFVADCFKRASGASITTAALRSANPGG